MRKMFCGNKKMWLCLLTTVFGFLAVFAVMKTDVAAEEGTAIVECSANGADTEDDTAEIQACLDTAINNSSTIVKIPAGTYYINKTLIIYSNTTLQLDAGAEIVRTDCSKIMIRSEQNYDIGGYGQAQNITIDGGIWNGNVTDTTVLSSLMYFCHGSNITLQNFTVKSACARHMVIVAGVDTAYVNNVTFTGFVLYTGADENNEYFNIEGEATEGDQKSAMRTMEALHLDCISADGLSESTAYPCDNTVNRNITVENCIFDGIMSGVGSHYFADENAKGSGLTIINNTFTNMKYTCVDVYNQNEVNVSGNTASNVGELVRVVNSSGSITGNKVACNDDPEESSVALCGMKVTNSTDMSIANNEVNGGVQGIYLSAVTGTVSGNSISNAQGNAITAIDYSDVDIIDNIITTSGANGIYVENGNSDINNNTISDCTSHGIAVYSSECGISGNRVSDVKVYGVCINNSTAEVSLNTIENTISHGVYALEDAKVAVKENTLAGNGENAIYLSQATGTVSNNTIQDSGAQGILLLNSVNASSDMTSVEYNQITSAGDYGIKVENSAYATVANNEICKSVSQGINIYNSNNVGVNNNTLTENLSDDISIYDSESIDVKSNTTDITAKSAVAAYNSSKVTISDNSIMRPNTGVLLNNTQAEVSGNTIDSTTEKGVWLLSQANGTVTNNIIKNTGTQGIHVNNATGVISGNTIAASGDKGIYIYASSNTASNKLKISNNEIANSADRGIQLEGSTYVTITGNTVKDCVQQGVRCINSCNYIWIEKNTVTGNQKHGVIVDNSKNVKINENIVKNNTTKEISILNGSTGTAESNIVDSLGTYTYDNSKFKIVTCTGMLSVQGTWYYVVNNVVDESYTGMAKNAYGWWYIKNGKLDRTYTGMAKNAYGWWYMTKGKLDTSYTGMAKNDYGWWYMTKGKLDRTYTGMAKNAYGWWYMTKGKLDTSYTGMAKNAYGWWYITKGKLDRTYTGMAKNAYGWWYMKNGKLDTTFTGIASNDYGKWYMKKGKLDKTYSGTVKIDGVSYQIKNGEVIG